jgi:hypothetical protein
MLRGGRPLTNSRPQRPKNAFVNRTHNDVTADFHALEVFSTGHIVATDVHRKRRGTLNQELRAPRRRR